ncbi:MAG: DUF1294 domain-containing protein [Verrucomicrobiae bacterium]|nr:DUF1294 domain-containing protein [Verrucomicrobiae bacterium]
MSIVQFLTVVVAFSVWSGLRAHPLAAWLLTVNAFGFGVFGCDKFFAKRGWRRVSEADLLVYTLVGGTLGTWLGMRAFRHKTRKESFRKAFRIVVAGQGLLLAGVICWMAFR